MSIAQHIWELVLFLLIMAGPLPFCLCLCLQTRAAIFRSFVHQVLVVLTSWSIIQISLGLLLGTIDRLTLNWVLFVETSLLISGFIILTIQPSFRWPALQKLPKFQFTQTETLILSSLFATGIVLLIRLIQQPITDFDSLAFHLPAIARWYQAESLTLLDPAGNWIFDHADARVYPYNWHILSALMLMPFREDLFITLPLLISWSILGIVIYLLSRKFGASRVYSLAAASLVLTLPMLLDQINTSHVDLPLATFLLVSLYFVLSYQQTRSPVEFVLFLSSLGLVAGIKLIGIIYAGVLILVLVVLEAKAFLLRKNINAQYHQIISSKPFVVSGAVIALFLGGFWYSRNFLEMQHYVASFNSILVASTQIPAASVWVGLQRLQSTTLTHQFDVTSLANWRVFILQLLLRLQLPFLAMLSQAVCLPYLLLTRRSDRKNLAPLSLLFLLLGLLYRNTPYSSGTDGSFPGQISPLFGTNLRYGYPFLFMFGVVSAVVASRFKASRRIVLILVLLSSVLGIVGSTILSVSRSDSFRAGKIVWIGQIFSHFGAFSGEKSVSLSNDLARNGLFTILIYVGIYAAIVLLASALLQFPSYFSFQFIQQKNFQRSVQSASLLACVGLLVVSTWMLRENREIQRTAIYRGIYEYLDANLVPNEAIAYSLSSRSYLFYGKHFEHPVLHVPLVPNELDQWLTKLEQQNIQLVAVGPVSVKQKPAAESLLSAIETGKLTPILGGDFDNEPVLYQRNN